MIKKRIKNIVYGFFFELEKDLGYKFDIKEQKIFSTKITEIVYRRKKGKFTDEGFIMYRQALSTNCAMDLLCELRTSMEITGCRFSFEFMCKFIEEIEDRRDEDFRKQKLGKMRGLKIGKNVEYENMLFNRDNNLIKMDKARFEFSGNYKSCKEKKVSRSFVNTSFERGCFQRAISVQDEFEKGMGAQERRLNGGKITKKSKKVSVSPLSKKQELEIEKTGRMIGKFF